MLCRMTSAEARLSSNKTTQRRPRINTTASMRARSSKRKNSSFKASRTSLSRGSSMSDRPKCCICLDVFSRPVPLPCGHVFCLSCIGEYWRVQGQCLCPLCKACFKSRPQLKVLETGFSQCDGDEGYSCDLPHQPFPSVGLKGTVETERSERCENHTDQVVSSILRKATAETVSDGCQAPLRAGEVPCDLCPVPRAALKSCVECLASYCDFHLQPHYQDAELGRHLLVDVVKNLEGPVCKVHGRQLEWFCRTDQTCICAICAQADHRGHRAVTVKKEAMRKKVQLKRKHSRLAQTIQERLSEVEELKLTAEIENNKDLMIELEEDTAELQRRQDEVDQLLQMDDNLHFLQRFLLAAPL